MENYQEETSWLEGFLLNLSNNILAKGRSRTQTSKVGEEELGQNQGWGDNLAGFFAKLDLGRPKTESKGKGVAEKSVQRSLTKLLLRRAFIVTALTLDTQNAGGSARNHRQQLTSTGSVWEQNINGAREEEDPVVNVKGALICLPHWSLRKPYY